MTDPNNLDHYFALEQAVKDLRESGREWYEKWEKAAFDCEQLKMELAELRSAVDCVLEAQEHMLIQQDGLMPVTKVSKAIDKLREVRG